MRKIFISQITLGEMMAVLSMLGGMGAFAMKFEGRMVQIETSQTFQNARIAKIETVVEKQADNQAQLIQMLQKAKP